MEYLEEPYSKAVADGLYTWESLRSTYETCPAIVALCDRRISEGAQRAKVEGTESAKVEGKRTAVTR